MDKKITTKQEEATATAVQIEDNVACNFGVNFFKKDYFLQENRSKVKVAGLLITFGVLMLVMGGVIYFEKPRIKSEAKGNEVMGSDYAGIAGNVLLVLGTLFVVLALLQLSCCSFQGCCSEDDNDSDTEKKFRSRIFSDASSFAVSQSCVMSYRRNQPSDLSSVNSVSVDVYEEPPQYHEVIKDSNSPPSYLEVIDGCEVCSGMQKVTVLTI